ncbi:MAG: hypothetical protein ACP5Q5_09470 [Brevinematia bacterium]
MKKFNRIVGFTFLVMLVLTACQVATENSGGSSATPSDKDKFKGHWELNHVEPDLTNLVYIQLSNEILTNVPSDITQQITVSLASMFMHVYFDDNYLTNFQIIELLAVLTTISNDQTNTLDLINFNTNSAMDLYFIDEAQKKMTIVKTNLTETNMVLYYTFVSNNTRVIMRLDTNFQFIGISNMIFDKK